MEICKKIFSNFFLSLFLVFIFSNLSFGSETFKKLGSKKVSFFDFFLLKFENTINKRTKILTREMFATRVQYSHIGIQINLDQKKEAIIVDFYAVMDKRRYSKKKYIQKLSDCNQIRNLIFYQKSGYKFFSQKRDPALTHSLMKDMFKETFLNNIDFNEKEIDFLLDNMFVNITILHPIKKKELSCYGKVNDYELK